MNLSDVLLELKLKQKAFPLTTYLTLVSKAQYDCYIDYCDGARALYNYLTDNGRLQLTSPAINQLLSAPCILRQNYFIIELAKIIAAKGVDPQILPNLSESSHWERLIHYSLREIL